MKRIGSIAVAWFAMTVPFAPGQAAAQSDAADVRQIQPYLMLIIDTSGSMERLPACTCTSPACEECLPDCSLPNVDGAPPVGADGKQLKKNRWAITLEALTGTFNDFECESLPRTSESGLFTYDLGYYLPYHQPWTCENGDGTICAFDEGSSGNASLRNQNPDGILDQYAGRVRFGLMTFDGYDTYVGAPPQVPAASFDHGRSESVNGLWSYGGAKAVNYPGCDYDYMIDTGARSEVADEGTLVSLNSCTGGGAPGGSTSCPSWCTTCDGNEAAINNDIQEALLSARPYGGTPIAGSLDDLYYHLKDGLSDTYGSCRNRYALLVTDGYPDSDYRDVGCNCASDNSGDPQPCGGDPTMPRFDPSLKKCPYPTPTQAALDLVEGRGDDPPMLERLYVVGLDVADEVVLGELNAIAEAGCLEEDCTHDGTNAAFFADDLQRLVDGLGNIIANLTEPISRSVPAFVQGSAQSVNKQYQISSGFLMPDGLNVPRTGIIERRRFECESGALVERALESASSTLQGDRFHAVLNEQDERVLLTAIPPTGSDWPTTGTPVPTEHLYRDETTAPCEATDGCQEVELDTLSEDQTFGLTVSDTATVQDIMNWTYGLTPPRSTRKLGDIYHSSPVIMAPPRYDTGDEAFNAFRRLTSIITRPITMFIGTNDGMLHAFSVEAHSDLTPAIRAGQELWGFVPPLLLSRLKNNLGGAHHFMVDATPVVKNVFFNRTPGQVGSAADYHSVLISGLREGGNAYFALDVTDPLDPKFLWQVTDPQMGKTFGQAAIGQARYLHYTTGDAGHFRNGTAGTARESAVAILPGGVGQVGPAPGDCDNGATNPTMRTTPGDTVFKSFQAPSGEDQFNHRSDVRCWRDQGRALYFVEVETGRIIKKIYLDSDGKRVFPSPIVSTPAIYQADTGTLMTKAFVVDADGVIWRIDMSDVDPKPDDPYDGWTVRPFHDIFFDTGPAAGEVSYEAPMLSIDEEGRLVVIVGTGDTNNFEKPNARNRIVSLTEREELTPESVERFQAAVNWELRVTGESSGARLVDSELVTGTMALFNGTLYVGTFIAAAGSDACDLGTGRIHALHYRARDTTQPNGTSGTYAPLLMEAAFSGYESVINPEPEDAISNLMLMGLSLTQRPTCREADPENFDVFGRDVYAPQDVVDPALYLVAQASGGSSAAAKRAGSTLSTVEVQVNKPPAMSRIVSWATSVD